jgi:hypothetical protein
MFYFFSYLSSISRVRLALVEALPPNGVEVAFLDVDEVLEADSDDVLENVLFRSNDLRV